MNAKITIAVCAVVAMMNHASAAIVDVDTELRASASSEDPEHPENWDFRITDERTATFSGYGSLSVGAQTRVVAWADVTAQVQPRAIGIETLFSLTGESEGFRREGTATATVNFNLSEAGVWSARLVSLRDNSEFGLREAEVSLLREGQEVYRQDCSFDLGFSFCGPYYGNRESPPNPYHSGVLLDPTSTVSTSNYLILQ